jgi:Domain of unknown function (DUF4440)
MSRKIRGTGRLRRALAVMLPVIAAVATSLAMASGPATGAARPPSASSAGAAAPAGRAREEGEAAENALRALEERWQRSEDDPVALETILAPDFVHVVPSGFATKAEHIAFARHRRPPASPSSRRFEKLRVRLYGMTGIVNGIVVTVAADGSVERTLLTDVFVRRKGRWQAVNAQELPFR